VKKPIVIVFGNPKGGTGKSTLSVHFLIRLLKLGFSVSSIDCDVNQGTMSRYLLNRIKSVQSGNNLITGRHTTLSRSALKEYDFSSLSEIFSFFGLQTNNQDGVLEFEKTLESFSDSDFVIIDTPGSIDELFLTAHSYADIVITPINDSLIDLDLIGDLNHNNLRLGVYSESLWEAKKKKAERSKTPINWIVLKNRMTGAKSSNSDNIDQLLIQMSKKLGFTLANGMCERIIFRELFKDGKTVFDDESQSLSHIVARSEVDYLIKSIFDIVKKMN
jgi:chromosome partitioning protein